MYYTEFRDDKVFFKEGYVDFNNQKTVIIPKRKLNVKYHVYNEYNEDKLLMDTDVFRITDVVSEDDKLIVFYVDRNKLLSFFVTKIENKERINEILYRLEHTPNYFMKTFITKKNIYCFGTLKLKDNQNVSEIGISVGSKKTVYNKFNYFFSSKIRKRFLKRKNKLSLIFNLGYVKISMDKVIEYYHDTSDINMPMYITISDNIDDKYYFQLKERSKNKRSSRYYVWNTRNCNITDELAIYIRKSISGQYVAVMSTTLSKKIAFNEIVGFIKAGCSVKHEKNLIFYEKFCEGAQESAFELFKYFYEQNCDNIYYILDENNANFNKLKEKYGAKVLAKNSIQAFYVIFTAKAFISSDLISHIQRRLYDNSKLIKRKILSNNKKIFLQHGVCLATDIFARGYFNTRVPIAPDYIFVNSDMEKNLFMERTNYQENQLIKAGLVNMDLYVDSKNNLKDEITFLLTWRPWDLLGDLDDNTYLGRYISFLKLINNDEFYKDKKVNIILHPKAKHILSSQKPALYNQLKKHLYSGDIKDVLIKSKVLITDYSSVSFFGFSGGSNIIFYWEDKERAEQEYGAPNILQANNCFGDVCMKFDDLNSLIKKNYSSKQDMLYIAKFGRMVETSNGDNTLRAYYAIKKIVE